MFGGSDSDRTIVGREAFASGSAGGREDLPPVVGQVSRRTILMIRPADIAASPRRSIRSAETSHGAARRNRSCLHRRFGFDRPAPVANDLGDGADPTGGTRKSPTPKARKPLRGEFRPPRPAKPKPPHDDWPRHESRFGGTRNDEPPDDDSRRSANRFD